jgi:2-oxoglutarate ferredoxin oxidoreductase subunit delta
MAKKKKTYLLKINEDLCKSCSLCIDFCPKGVLALSVKLNKKGVPFAKTVKAEDCTGCRSCVLVCPEACIELSEVD